MDFRAEIAFWSTVATATAKASARAGDSVANKLFVETANYARDRVKHWLAMEASAIGKDPHAA
jgi:hypothetical protein